MLLFDPNNRKMDFQTDRHRKAAHHKGRSRRHRTDYRGTLESRGQCFFSGETGM